jgi:hypothetical protein
MAVPLDVLPERITTSHRRAGDEPAIVIHRIGGGDDRGDAPLERPLVQLDVSSSSEAVTAERASALKALLRSIKGRTMLTTTLACWGITIVSDVLLVEGDRLVTRSITVELMTGGDNAE